MAVRSDKVEERTRIQHEKSLAKRDMDPFAENVGCILDDEDLAEGKAHG